MTQPLEIPHLINRLLVIEFFDKSLSEFINENLNLEDLKSHNDLILNDKYDIIFKLYHTLLTSKNPINLPLEDLFPFKIGNIIYNNNIHVPLLYESANLQNNKILAKHIKNDLSFLM